MNLPQSFIESLAGIRGFEKKSFEAVHQTGEQVTSIRLHPQKYAIVQSDLLDGKVPWNSNGFYLKERPSFTLDPLFHAGAYYVQEASSMFLEHALQSIIKGAGKGLKILDLCAAPGGKSTLLASLYPEALIVSNEVIKSRAAILVENTTKWGMPNMVVTNNDPEHFKDFTGFFDVIVVDAPCSGSGMFRKDPDAINEWSEQNVIHCSQRQERILANIVPCLKENGLLVYSTCSYSLAENEKIADWLVSEMKLESRPIQIENHWNIIETISDQQNAYGYRFYPNLLKGEGFYLAVFQQTGTVGQDRLRKVSLVQPGKSELEGLAPFTADFSNAYYFKQNNAIRYFSESFVSDLQALSSRLYIKKAGVELGEFKGKSLIPSHEWAVSVLPKNGFSSIQLDNDTAIQFLKRGIFSVEHADTGWNWVRFQGMVLGLVKVLPNRINNYYPSEWRILKD